jgi:hypothetical protein
MITNNFQLYEDKSYEDLLKDIVTNAANKRDQIDITVSDLRDKIVTINDAIVLAPIIKEYLDVGVKNDDSLVKLAAIIQRFIAAQAEGDGTTFGISDAEKEQLLKEIKEIDLISKSPIEVKKVENK